MKAAVRSSPWIQYGETVRIPFLSMASAFHVFPGLPVSMSFVLRGRWAHHMLRAGRMGRGPAAVCPHPISTPQDTPPAQRRLDCKAVPKTSTFPAVELISLIFSES